MRLLWRCRGDARKLGPAPAAVPREPQGFASIAGARIARYEQAIAIAEPEGLKPTVAQAQMGLGAEHDDAGDLERAQREMAVGVALAREIGAPRLVGHGEAMLGFILCRRLGGTRSPDEAEALRRAKLRLLESPGRAHPYHWAPFVLVG